MDNPLNKFSPPLQKFFLDMQNYINLDLHFYGSVTRDDYVKGQSDIDVAIFSDNEKSTIAKLQHFLHVKQSAFEKLVWKLEGKMIYGYKIKCEQYIQYPSEAKKCEIAIYNVEFQDILMNEIKTQNIVPFHIAFLLFIIKTLYYKLQLISAPIYVKMKRFIFNTLLKHQTNSVFYLLKQNTY